MRCTATWRVNAVAAQNLTRVRMVEPRARMRHTWPTSERSPPMPKYNRNFELTLSDIDLIEAALNVVTRDLSLGREGARALLPTVPENDHVSQINDLLGRLHNQKIFYRPSDEPYVSG